MHIDSLFVNENSRGKGYGTILIKKAEELASKRNCSFCYLGTMDFKAKPFYEKLGYKVEYVREGYDNKFSYVSDEKKLNFKKVKI